MKWNTDWPVIAGFVCFALVLIVYFVQWLRLRSDRRPGWMRDRDWGSGRIPSAPRERYALVLGAVGASAVLGSRWVLGGTKLTDALRLHDEVGYFSLAFLAAGALCVLLSIVQTSGVALFGRPLFVCSRAPFVLGETLEGWVQTRANRMLERGVKVIIECLRTDREDNQRLWAEDAFVSGHKIMQRDGTARIPVAFELPRDSHPTEHNIAWMVTVRAGSPPFGLHARFAVPVAAATAQPVMRKARSAKEERKITVLESADADIAVAQSSKPLGYVAAMGGVGVGSLLFAVVLWINDEWPLFLCLIAAAFSLGPLYRAADAAFGRSSIHISRGTVVVNRLLFGRTSSQELNAGEIRGIDIVVGNSPGLFWNVRLLTVDGKKIVAAPFIATKTLADAIARRLEDALKGFERAHITSLFGPDEPSMNHLH